MTQEDISELMGLLLANVAGDTTAETRERLGRLYCRLTVSDNPHELKAMIGGLLSGILTISKQADEGLDYVLDGLDEFLDNCEESEKGASGLN